MFSEGYRISFVKRLARSEDRRPREQLVRRAAVAEQHWSSGYDVRLTRGRSPVQSWDAVFLQLSYFPGDPALSIPSRDAQN